MPKKKSVLQGRRRPMGGLRGKVRTFLPASFRSHLKASIREGLLAFESLFDEAVKALEKEGRRDGERRGSRIRVE